MTALAVVGIVALSGLTFILGAVIVERWRASRPIPYTLTYACDFEATVASALGVANDSYAHGDAAVPQRELDRQVCERIWEASRVDK